MKEGHVVSFFRLNQHKNSTGEASFFNGNVLRFLEIDKQFLWKKTKYYRRLNTFFKLIHLLRPINDYRYNQTLPYYYRYNAIVTLQEHLISNTYDFVIVNYVTNAYLLKLFPRTTHKIIDTHDILANRYKIYLSNGVTPKWQSLFKRSEKKALELADTIWAITKKDKRYFEKSLSNKRVQHLTHYFTYDPVESSNFKSILFVGSDNPINQHGLNWFLDEIWPSVLKSEPQAKLILAGSICNSTGLASIDSSLELYGAFEDANEVYGLSNYCINPMKFGTGLKIKSLEALSKGKVLITTHAGAEGIEYLGDSSTFISDDPEEWVQYIVDCLRVGLGSSVQGNNAELFAKNNQEYILTLKDIFK